MPVASTQEISPAAVSDLRRHDLLVRAVDEDALGMRRREGAAAGRGAGLVQHRGALRRGLGEMDRIDAVETSLMPDPVDLCRVGEDAAVAVAQCGAVFPAALPALVDQLHVPLGDPLAPRM